MSSGCKLSKASKVTKASKVGVSLLLAALFVSCAEQQTSRPAVDVAPELLPVNVGPVPGVAESPEPIENPFAGNLAGLDDGRRFFVQYNCAGCHGDHGGGGMGPSLRDDVWLYGGTDAQIANSIAQGRAYGMPAWGSRLTRTQLWQIAAYLKSLRTAHEPDPPR
jgi:cytochrome c oxidase cbb3-type subunit III